MKKIIILVILCLLFLKVNVVDAESNSSYILIDFDSGRVLYEENMHERFLTASIAKIMTAMVAIEEGNLFDYYPVSYNAVNADGSKIYLELDDKIMLLDLIYGLMLRSGNDAATLISEVACENANIFVKQMNNIAKRIGMTNSTFENPTGLNDDTFNYSTAYDMALLMRYAMNNLVFRDIATTKTHYVKTINNSYVWTNKHKLIHRNNGVIAGKTGYTKLANRTLVSYAEINNKKMICVSFNHSDDYKLHEALFKKADIEFEETLILKDGVYPQKIKELNYYPKIDEEVRLLVKKDSNVYAKFILNKNSGFIEIYEDKLLIYKTPISLYWPIE